MLAESPRRDKLQWEKGLDEQREHRLQREGIFWHDDRLDGLSDDDRLVNGGDVWAATWNLVLFRSAVDFLGQSWCQIPDVLFFPLFFRTVASNDVGYIDIDY